jgi:hypothetical protein
MAGGKIRAWAVGPEQALARFPVACGLYGVGPDILRAKKAVFTNLSPSCRWAVDDTRVGGRAFSLFGNRSRVCLGVSGFPRARKAFLNL